MCLSPGNPFRRLPWSFVKEALYELENYDILKYMEVTRRLKIIRNLQCAAVVPAAGPGVLKTLVRSHRMRRENGLRLLNYSILRVTIIKMFQSLLCLSASCLEETNVGSL